MCYPQKQGFYLGQIISPEGISTNSSNAQRIKEWPIPHTVQEVQQFLGLASYVLQKIHPELCQYCKTITSSYRKGRPFKWTVECDISFEKLKICLSLSSYSSKVCVTGHG